MMKKRLASGLFAALVLLWTGCQSPLQNATSAPINGGSLSVTLPALAPSIADATKAGRGTARAFAYVNTYSLEVYNADSVLVASSYRSSSSTLAVPVGSNYTVKVYVFNAAVSSSTPTVWGTASGVNVVNGVTTPVSIGCVPYSPRPLSLGTLYSPALAAGGEVYYSLEATRGTSYTFTQTTNGLLLGLFARSGAALNDWSSTGSLSFTAQESGLVYLGVAATATQSGTANLTVAVATNDGNPTSPVPIIPGIPQTFHLGAANGGNSSSYYTFTPTESGSHLVDLDSSVATYTATLYSGSFGGTVELTATGSASGLVNLGTLTANTTYYLVLQNTSNAAYSSAGGSLAVPRVLPVGAPYTAGLVKVPRQSVWYVVPVTGGSTCLLNWDDSYQGSTTYSLDTEVSAYQANMTAYFTNRDTGYLSGSTPPVAVPLDQSSVFVKVRAFSAGPATGTFAIKATAQQPPAALAISIGTAQVGSPLSLVGSGTTGATSYAWTITTKPASSVAVISQATSANASFTPDVAGNYSFQLAATNSAGTSTSPVAVTVAPQPVPVASATYTGAPAIGSQFTLNGSGTTGASTYVWTITAKPSGSVTAIVSATYANAYFTPDAVGDYTFLLTVSNAAGSSTANLTVTVAPPPAPVARATSVASGQVGTPITLSGSGTTGASSYTWTVTSRPIGSTASLGSPTSATATLTPDLPGDYTFQLAATNLGGTSTATVSVTVTGGILSITVN